MWEILEFHGDFRYSFPLLFTLMFLLSDPILPKGNFFLTDVNLLFAFIYFMYSMSKLYLPPSFS